MLHNSNPLKIAVVGCGAFAEQYHLPVLSGHPKIKLQCLVDRDTDRRVRLAKAYKVTSHCSDVSELCSQVIDGVILATPPSHHCTGTIDLLEQGFHVLVEKPMAFNLADAQSMCTAAASNNRVLSVGVYKRLLPAIQLIKEMITNETYGKAVEASAEWGGIGAFNSATLGLMRKESAGGGVLMDLGPHILDILTFWFGDNATVTAYSDDSRGGIEADAEASIVFQSEHGRKGRIEVDLRLSRVRELSRGLRVRFEHATLSVAMDERFAVLVTPNNGNSPYSIQKPNLRTTAPWFDSYRDEIDDWITAIRHNRQPVLCGESCLTSIRLIDECYQKRVAISLPWQQNRTPVSLLSEHRPRVLVTGAGGFVGSRTAEILFDTGNWNIRGHVRRPGSASRLARRPIEIIQGDLKSDTDVTRMVRDCDAVVHCAVGTDYGSPTNIHSVTVGGTARLVDAALEAGVKRFIHISSIGVHDAAKNGEISSRTPLLLSKRDWYGYTKGLAERSVQKGKKKGLETVILRPGCIYGPFGYTFVMNPLRALMRDSLALEDSAETNSNTVYIDNVVEAIHLALEADYAHLHSFAYPVGDSESWTWGKYFDYFGQRVQKEIPRLEPSLASSSNKRSKNEQRSFINAMKSTEAKSFAKRVLQTDPIGTLPRWLFENLPSTETWIRNRLGMNEPEIFKRPTSFTSGPQIRFTARKCNISNAEIENELGYQGKTGRQIAMQQTFQWATYAGLLS